MQITIEMDDKYLEAAQKLTGMDDIEEILQKAVEDLVAKHSMLRLAKLGITESKIKKAKNRRFEVE